ncbi:MAG: hypothetical protein PF483_10495 [Halothiobacillus sp.]|nr:hypothetical protein [Halothiobacillus sp.]
MAPARALCDRLKVPKAVKELAVLTTAQHGRVHEALKMRPATLVDLIESLDGLRRPERMTDVLTACHADARGRLGSETCDYPQAERVLAAAEIVRSISPAPFLEQGLSGVQLGEALRQARTRALNDHLDPR